MASTTLGLSGADCLSVKCQSFDPGRPAFKEMFAAASRREFDLVLFWSLDRFSREGVLETLHHLQRLTSYGINYRSFTEAYLDSVASSERRS
ncbi:MAG: recombinase family protein [Acidobacteriaceae bacterium]